MIYLKNNSETQELYIPKNGDYQGKRTYKEGFEEGIEYQKSKLSSIEIKENGLYQNEDGYNEVLVNVPQEGGDCPELEEITINENGTYEGAYDRVIVDVPQEGGDLNPDNLREINITENGRYTSKYSEPIKTGEFEDGTPFYGYAELNNISYDTGILSDNDTKIELWWCGDVTQPDNAIIGYQSNGNFKVCVVNNGNLIDSLNAEINYNGANKQNLESNVWYHIELSKQEGFKINGELIGTFEGVGDIQNVTIYFNTLDGSNFANGKYGMLKINDTIFIPTENGFVNYANQEPMAVFTEGSYTYGTNEVDTEGEPYKTINVNIPPTKLQEKYEWRTDTEGFFTILPDEGYEGMSKVDVDIYEPLQAKYEEGFEQGKTEGKEDVINSLQTLNVTENGTYTPPLRSFLRLDGDDKYEMFNPSEVNAFEIKFRINGEGYEELFFSQNDNDNTFIGLKAYPSFSLLYVNWFNKQISISGVDFSKWHTLVVKMSDENARVILDGEVYNDYNEWSSYENNGASVNIYGNIDLEHFAFWETWEQYNNGDTPFFDFKVSPEGLMKNVMGGEYEVVENIGGGSAQYMGENISEGWKEVIVDVPQEGGSCNLGELNVEWASNWTENHYYPANQGLDGYNVVNINAENALNEKYNEGYEAGKSELEEVTITENGTYEGAYNKVIVNVPQEEVSGITSSIVEDTYSKLALRTTNVRPTDNFISDKTGLVNYINEEYTGDSYISYNQDMQGVVITKQPDFSSPSVSMIKRGALAWNGVNKLHTFTISVFGEDMARDTSSNILELHLHHYSTIMAGSTNITFKTGCFATCNRLNKIVFYDVYNIVVEVNAFESVNTSGQVIVVGTDTSENRAKYDALMTQLGDGWTLSFVNVYRE